MKHKHSPGTPDSRLNLRIVDTRCGVRPDVYTDSPAESNKRICYYYQLAPAITSERSAPPAHTTSWASFSRRVGGMRSTLSMRRSDAAAAALRLKRTSFGSVSLIGRSQFGKQATIRSLAFPILCRRSPRRKADSLRRDMPPQRFPNVC